MRIIFTWAALTALLATGIALADDAADGPVAVIDTRATALAEKMKGRQEYYAENTAELNALVDELLLPAGR